MTAMLRRPIFGGAFGNGQYELATQPTVSNGLHAVRFMVIQLAAGQVVSIAEEKREALSSARHLLRSVPPTFDEEEGWRQTALWPEVELVPGMPVAPVSRRRREVFERSGGACFYCRCRLSVHAFHVEHQRPRAIGGDDSPLNLVAACESCNLQKSDRTALEFVTAMNRRQ